MYTTPLTLKEHSTFFDRFYESIKTKKWSSDIDTINFKYNVTNSCLENNFKGDCTDVLHINGVIILKDKTEIIVTYKSIWSYKSNWWYFNKINDVNTIDLSEFSKFKYTN
jgi:hypothetical protein